MTQAAPVRAVQRHLSAVQSFLGVAALVADTGPDRRLLALAREAAELTLATWLPFDEVVAACRASGHEPPPNDAQALFAAVHQVAGELVRTSYPEA